MRILSGYLAFGDYTPSFPVDIRGETQNSSAVFIRMANSTASDAPAFTLQRGYGNLTTPTAIQNNALLGSLRYQGHDGTTFTGTRASIQASATENWTSTNNGTRLQFLLTKAGTITQFEHARISETGIAFLPLITGSRSSVHAQFDAADTTSSSPALYRAYYFNNDSTKIPA